jgi:hypothetical protein
MQGWLDAHVDLRFRAAGLMQTLLRPRLEHRLLWYVIVEARLDFSMLPCTTSQAKLHSAAYCVDSSVDERCARQAPVRSSARRRRRVSTPVTDCDVGGQEFTYRVGSVLLCRVRKGKTQEQRHPTPLPVLACLLRQ